LLYDSKPKTVKNFGVHHQSFENHEEAWFVFL